MKILNDLQNLQHVKRIQKVYEWKSITTKWTIDIQKLEEKIKYLVNGDNATISNCVNFEVALTSGHLESQLCIFKFIFVSCMNFSYYSFFEVFRHCCTVNVNLSIRIGHQKFLSSFIVPSRPLKHFKIFRFRFMTSHHKSISTLMCFICEAGDLIENSIELVDEYKAVCRLRIVRSDSKYTSANINLD